MAPYYFSFISMILKEILNLILIFFSDGSMLFSIINDPEISADHLNQDLDIIYQQATEVLFSCKKSSPNHPLLIFIKTAVTNVNEQKHLGLILDSVLSFEKHLTEKIIKAKKNIGLIKHLSKFLPIKKLDHLYKALVCPNLDYCDIIYHEPPQLNQPPLGKTLASLMAKVERILSWQIIPNSMRSWGGGGGGGGPIRSSNV